MLNAAFINAMSSAAVAFNDTHFATVAHPTSPVAAALLALAERQPMTGVDFLHALILGIEIQCRIGNILFTPPAECNIGLSMAGLVGGIGAAVAAAKAMGLNETGIATALGHAANQAGGLRESHATMGSQFTPGHTARCGLMSTLLAARGFTCSDTMIEGEKGFGVSFGTQPNFDAAVEGLGKSFEITTLAYKPYPCGFVVHPVIDACLDLARDNTFNAEDIVRVELTVSPLAARLADRARTDRPQSVAGQPAALGGGIHHLQNRRPRANGRRRCARSGGGAAAAQGHHCHRCEIRRRNGDRAHRAEKRPDLRNACRALPRQHRPPADRRRGHRKNPRAMPAGVRRRQNGRPHRRRLGHRTVTASVGAYAATLASLTNT